MKQRHLLFTSAVVVIVSSSFLAGAAKAEKVSGDGAYQDSVLRWPWLRNSGISAKLRYAEEVSDWAEHVQPIKDYDPAKLRGIPQAIRKLMDALSQLHRIKDTEGHRAAVEYKETVNNPVSAFIGDQIKDKGEEKAIAYLIGKAAAEYFSLIGIAVSLSAVVPLADPDMLRRDMLIKNLGNQLSRYEARYPPQPITSHITVSGPPPPPPGFGQPLPDQAYFARQRDAQAFANRPLPGAQPKAPASAFPSTINIKPAPSQPLQPLHLPTKAAQPPPVEQQAPSIERQP